MSARHKPSRALHTKMVVLLSEKLEIILNTWVFRLSCSCSRAGSGVLTGKSGAFHVGPCLFFSFFNVTECS